MKTGKDCNKLQQHQQQQQSWNKICIHVYTRTHTQQWFPRIKTVVAKSLGPIYIRAISILHPGDKMIFLIGVILLQYWRVASTTAGTAEATVACWPVVYCRELSGPHTTIQKWLPRHIQEVNLTIWSIHMHIAQPLKALKDLGTNNNDWALWFQHQGRFLYLNGGSYIFG